MEFKNVGIKRQRIDVQNIDTELDTVPHRGTTPTTPNMHVKANIEWYPAGDTVMVLSLRIKWEGRGLLDYAYIQKINDQNIRDMHSAYKDRRLRPWWFEFTVTKLEDNTWRVALADEFNVAYENALVALGHSVVSYPVIQYVINSSLVNFYTVDETTYDYLVKNNPKVLVERITYIDLETQFSVNPFITRADSYPTNMVTNARDMLVSILKKTERMVRLFPTEMLNQLPEWAKLLSVVEQHNLRVGASHPDL